MRLWRPSTQDYVFQQKREASRLLFSLAYYLTTILTILFGTTMTFTMVLPSVNFWISGRAWAFSPISSRAIATGTEIVARTLPLTWTASSTSLTTRADSSQAGQAAKWMLSSFCPAPCQSSSVICGTNGARRMRRFLTSSPERLASMISWASMKRYISFTSSMMAEIAVLKANFPSRSSVTFLMVWCSFLLRANSSEESLPFSSVWMSSYLPTMFQTRFRKR